MNLFPLYRLLTAAAAPLLPWWQKRRAAQGKEDPARAGERFGRTTRSRPAGGLLWCHAASLGESQSVLPLIAAFLEAHADWSVLVTTGTVSSARSLEQRLPARAFHQYVPYDTPRAVRRFLDHWRPDRAWWVESELWPNLVLETAKRCPLALVNARMSADSAERWRRLPAAIRPLLGAFRPILAQSEEDAARLRRLGAKGVEMQGNLKLAAAPLAVPDDARRTLEALLGSRPRFLAASTHPGEEERIAAVHRRLSRDWPDLVTIVVPRHAARGDAVARLLREQGHAVAQRSKGEAVTGRQSFYVADTMGELGLFYRACGIAFVGGSLVPHGGQNPLEAARLGCAVLYGPHMENFPDICRLLEKEGGAIRVADGDALALAVRRLMDDEEERRRVAEAGRLTAEGQHGVLAAVLKRLLGDGASEGVR